MIQEEILAYNEQTIVPTYIAPKRNKHIFGVFSNDIDNSFYFNPNYSYGSDQIPIYQQQVIINGETSKTDKYAIFSVKTNSGNTEKTLYIDYEGE